MQQTQIPQLPGLKGRVVIVAGAGGGGIGTTITKYIAGAGATVIAVDCSADSINTYIKPLINEGFSIVTLVTDTLSDEGIAEVIQLARQTEGELHGLVTVVGGAPPTTWGPATKLSREHWQSQITLNLDSMFYMTQAVAAELQAQGRSGSLVSISSINGLTSSPFNVGYGAGKAALGSVVETMSLELATSGIRVNAIAPGPIETPVANLSQDPQRLRRGIPMARYGSAEEIAGPVLFLLSDLSAFMTGQCLIVDGGCSIKWCHLTDDNLPMFLKEASVNEALKN